jgi:hypothetical protein
MEKETLGNCPQRFKALRGARSSGWSLRLSLSKPIETLWVTIEVCKVERG